LLTRKARPFPKMEPPTDGKRPFIHDFLELFLLLRLVPVGAQYQVAGAAIVPRATGAKPTSSTRRRFPQRLRRTSRPQPNYDLISRDVRSWEARDTGKCARPRYRFQPSEEEDGNAVSESQLHPKLDLPGAGCEVRSLHLRSRLAEGTGIGDEVSGLAELDAIEQVVALRTELKVDALCGAQGSPLVQGLNASNGVSGLRETP
jgi:hypothetical protein